MVKRTHTSQKGFRIYRTLMLWKKGKKSFSKKELTPVKSIKVSDDKKSVEIVMADKTVKKVTF